MAPTLQQARGELLDRIPAADREELERLAARRHVARGELLIRQGDLADRVVALLAGRVKVTSIGPNGQELILAFRGPGAVLGEQGALDHLPRSATVTAIEDVEVLVLAASSFRTYLERHPAVAMTIIALLSERLRDSDRRRIEFASYGTLERLAARLVELSMEYSPELERGEPITVPITQEELAGWTASSLESVARALRTLRSTGWVETGRGRLVVHDVDALVRLLA